MSKNDGGSAFPHEEQMDSFTSKIIQCSQGLSIRDYFAAKAMQGISERFVEAELDIVEKCIPVAAMLSFMIADAMILERAK